MTFGSRWSLSAGLWVGGVLLSAAWLVALPGTFTLYAFTPADTLNQAPGSTQDYVQAPSLAAYREHFRESCSEAVTAASAARCINDLLNSRFPHAVPRSEMFNRDYEPAPALAAHLNGAPGHCTTRSALLATMMLANGFAARVVQVQVPELGGHTLVEWWEDGRWHAIDPSYGVILGADSNPQSVSELLGHEQVQALEQLRSPTPIESFASAPYPYFKHRNGARVLYPEPWLYTREGPHAAPPPFRSFTRVEGAPAWAFGVQNWIATALLATSIVGAIFTAWRGAQRVRSRR